MKKILLILLVFSFYASLSLQAEVIRLCIAVPQQQESSLKKIKIETIHNQIIVENAPHGSKLEIYNVVGVKVKEIQLKEGVSTYNLDIPKGYYIVRVGEVVRKVVIR